MYIYVLKLHFTSQTDWAGSAWQGVLQRFRSHVDNCALLLSELEAHEGMEDAHDTLDDSLGLEHSRAVRTL